VDLSRGLTSTDHAGSAGKKAALSNQDILAMVRVQFPDATMVAAGTNKKKEGVVPQSGQMSVESLGTKSTDLLGEVGVYE